MIETQIHNTKTENRFRLLLLFFGSEIDVDVEVWVKLLVEGVFLTLQNKIWRMITLVFRQLENNKWNSNMNITASTHNHHRLHTTIDSAHFQTQITHKGEREHFDLSFAFKDENGWKLMNRIHIGIPAHCFIAVWFWKSVFGFWCIKINKCQCQQTLTCHFQSFLDIVQCSRYFGYAVFGLLNRCAFLFVNLSALNNNRHILEHDLMWHSEVEWESYRWKWKYDWRFSMRIE